MTEPPGADPNGRRAMIALAVGAIGTVGFVIGLRAAMRRIPPERPQRADSSGVVVDSARPRRQTAPQSEPDAYPRLR